MSGSDKTYQLDETTLYSVLNLKYGATEVQIRKAYMKLARELHPDKSKSEEAGELFKKVAHAHFILTDKKEKMKYDSKLLAKGLYDYSPRIPNDKSRQNGMFKDTAKNSKTFTNNNNKDDARADTSKSKPRKSRPYEEQPYGFGVDTGRGSGKNIPLFKTFNAKSYQNSKKSVTPPRPKQPSEKNKRATSFSNENRNSSSVPMAKNQAKKTANSGSAVGSESRISSSGSESSSNVNSATGSSEEPDVHTQHKMARKDSYLSGFQSKARSPESPFQDPAQRHFVRTKYVSSRYDKRSLSPVKTTPNSSTETLNNVKNIFNSMSDRLRHTLFGNSNGDAEDEDQHNTQHDTERLFKRAKLPGRKILTDEEIDEIVKQQNEAESNDPDRQDYGNSFNLNVDNLSVNTQDFNHISEPSPEKEETKANKAPFLEEVYEIKSDNEHLEEKAAVSPDDGIDTLGLNELGETLPNNKEPFDMRNVGDSLDNYQVKRMKVSPKPRSVPSKTTPGSSHAEENLQEPVNIPLPRIYKLDPIPIEKFNVDLSISNIKLPEMPNLLCNVLDKAQVLECQQKTAEFTKQTNETKRKLLHILSQRCSADEELHDKLYRVENVNRMVEAKLYDLELMTKLSELLNRQRMVAENYAIMINTMYASGLLEKN